METVDRKSVTLEDKLKEFKVKLDALAFLLRSVQEQSTSMQETGSGGPVNVGVAAVAVHLYPLYLSTHM